MSTAAHKYGILPSTLHDHLIKGTSKKAGAGGLSVLMAGEEGEVHVALTPLALADMGFGLTRGLEVVLMDYLKNLSIPT